MGGAANGLIIALVGMALSFQLTDIIKELKESNATAKAALEVCK